MRSNYLLTSFEMNCRHKCRECERKHGWMAERYFPARVCLHPSTYCGRIHRNHS